MIKFGVSLAAGTAARLGLFAGTAAVGSSSLAGPLQVADFGGELTQKYVRAGNIARLVLAEIRDAGVSRATVRQSADPDVPFTRACEDYEG
ncbi:hypothetical protein ACMATS_00715 [Streptoverticillium reticulum]|uniref:hypothetical protein n=1 Tax=Streptoverticillium reticulum TaxID=1433415 RepID=UPI0039BF9528